MAKDENGVDAVARDGQPDDELKKRRGRRSGNGAKDAAGSISERAAAEEEPPVGEEEDGQFFVWEHGRRVTLGSLVKAGVDVKHVFVFAGKRVKGKGGLMALDEQPMLVVQGITSAVKVVPTHDDHGRVTLVTIENHVSAQVVHPADSDDAMHMLASIIEKRAASDAA